MRVRLDPPIHDWPTPRDDRPIVTGHQQTLFHPGILAKYAAAAAKGAYTHIVVDQDVYDPLALDLPAREGERLSAGRHHLARIAPEVPPACQRPADPAAIAAVLKKLAWPEDAAVSAWALIEAYAETTGTATLAQQAWAVNAAMMTRVGIDPPRALYASELLRDARHAWVVEALLRDAHRSAELYNDAVQAFPGAGMTPLRIEPFMVEVPLWLLGWGVARQRVFVDTADTTPLFVTEDGTPIDLQDKGVIGFAPRALLMTALLRDPDAAALFIHGTGGWAYDRITEQWWERWQGRMLAPMALATADLYLDFHAPVAERADLDRSMWFRHHIKDNIDRYTTVDPALAARKRELLAHMDDDRDRKRRAAAFAELHRINDALCRQHPDVIEQADAALQRARAGVTNRRIAQRRDWYFGLYPQARLDDLNAAIASCLGKVKLP